jgi:uridine kinase
VRQTDVRLQFSHGVTTVGFVGASGSGKTTFTSRLEKLMNNVTVLSMDMYNQGDKVLENNFDDPRIIDYDYLLSNLEDLRNSRPTKAPIYDFKTSKRVGYRDVAVPESRVVIIEVRKS